MSVFDPSGNISVIGTGEDELFSGAPGVRELFQRNFSEATASKFEWGWYDIVISSGCVVVSQCLTIYLNTEGGEISVPVRWTVVLKKVERWL
ncbi:nuclear transport factor 2 family protein [Vibrio proteolyticus]|uniref:SnoaL-like domain-containing protein n=1 Tax=Vibrio proteolyticus NBRC 13287 TaxID=1219065 RepID=U3BAY6_VIBPR|nr:hypothetical protein VPR01S_05_02490 [Vibrio proteolyticus NBRC 13287]